MTFTLKQNTLIYAILVFLILFSIFHYIKPGFAYNELGGFRQFGVGYKNKTIFPIWVVAIILAIFSFVIGRIRF
jgi:hypothetical protein